MQPMCSSGEEGIVSGEYVGGHLVGQAGEPREEAALLFCDRAVARGLPASRRVPRFLPRPHPSALTTSYVPTSLGFPLSGLQHRSPGGTNHLSCP